jgi:hypothetical protein
MFSSVNNITQPSLCCNVTTCDVQGDAAPQPASRLVYQALTAELNKKSKQYHAVLFAGDLAYAEGESAQWQAFLINIQSIVQRLTGMYIPGNCQCCCSTTRLVGCKSQ